MRIFLATLLSTLFFVGCGTQSQQPTNATNTANTSSASQSAPGTTAGAEASTSTNPSATPASNPNTGSAETESTDSEGNKKVNVHFAAGKSEGSYSNTFSGYSYVDYEFKASADQTLTAELVKSDKDAIITVMKNGLAIEPDSAQVTGWTGKLPDDGSYTIRVGQMRAAARRSDRPKDFTLRISIVD